MNVCAPTHTARKPTLLCIWLTPPGQGGEFCRNKWPLEPVVSWVLCQWVFKLLACRSHGIASFIVLFGLELSKLQAMSLATVTQRQWTHPSVSWICSVLLPLRASTLALATLRDKIGGLLDVSKHWPCSYVIVKIPTCRQAQTTVNPGVPMVRIHTCEAQANFKWDLRPFAYRRLVSVCVRIPSCVVTL